MGAGGKRGRSRSDRNVSDLAGFVLAVALALTIYTHSGIQTDSGERLRKPSRKIGSNWHL